MGLLRRWVLRRVIGFIWVGRGPVHPGEIMSPLDVEVVFRGKG